VPVLGVDSSFPFAASTGYDFWGWIELKILKRTRFERTRTMYGLSLMASLLCASATRRFASATLRAMSSFIEGDAGVEMILGFAGEALGKVDLTGAGATMAPSDFVVIAATFAAISALF